MSYLVLARKWRPQTFDDLVGQEHVARTLRNAISQGRVAHAFLFTGARGVGKTTIARVLAKALNCLSSDGPTGQPCTRCAACEEIARGNDPDVREIDGASNTSVDNVRALQESLPFLPTRDRFKVVIIDEVHMLSTGAFNALLKTLEEPPPHVKFVFATTEVHKVPITILSRCQRYDFKLLPAQKIRERVEHVLREEGIGFDDAAVGLVAREAAGSMRDALSLLDQVIAGCDGTLRGDEASRLIGVADRKVLHDLARQIVSGDAPAALQTLRSVADEGYDLTTFARDLLALVRDLVVARVVPEPDSLLDLADDEKRDVIALASTTDAADLERLFVALSRTVDEVSRAREPRWALEMAAIRLAQRPALVPMDELVGRLVDLERRVGNPGGGPAPSGGGAPRGPARGPAAPPRSGAATSAPSPRAGATATSAAAVVTPIPRPEARASTAVAAAPATQPETRVQPTVRPSAPAPAAPPETEPDPMPFETTDHERLDTWARVLSGLPQGTAALGQQAWVQEISPARIVLAFEPGGFHFRRVNTAEVREQLARAALDTLGAAAEIVIRADPDARRAPSLARRSNEARAARNAARTEAAREHPAVRKVVAALQGQILEVRLTEEPAPDPSR